MKVPTNQQPAGRHSHNNLSRDFARRLRDARVKAEWTQSDLSYESGLSQAHIAKLESGVITPMWGTLRQLLMALDLPAEYLLCLPQRRGR